MRHGELDMTHTASPLQVDPDTEVAHLEIGGWVASVRMVGKTDVEYGDKRYHKWKDFPHQLKEAIQNGPDESFDGAIVHASPAFELSVFGLDGNLAKREDCDCCGMCADAMRDMLQKILEEEGAEIYVGNVWKE